MFIPFENSSSRPNFFKFIKISHRTRQINDITSVYRDGKNIALSLHWYYGKVTYIKPRNAK